MFKKFLSTFMAFLLCFSLFTVPVKCSGIVHDNGIYNGGTVKYDISTPFGQTYANLYENSNGTLTLDLDPNYYSGRVFGDYSTYYGDRGTLIELSKEKLTTTNILTAACTGSIGRWDSNSGDPGTYISSAIITKNGWYALRYREWLDLPYIATENEEAWNFYVDYFPDTEGPKITTKLTSINVDGNITAKKLNITLTDESNPIYYSISSDEYNVSNVLYSAAFSYNFSKNQTVEITAKDSLGNVSSKQINITGIIQTDTTGPAISEEVTPTGSAISKTLSFSITDETNGINQYSVSSADWNVPYTDYSSVVSHTFTKNQDVTISAKDSLGNVSSKVVSINGIDLNAPIISESVTLSSDEKSKILSFTLSDASIPIQYSVSSADWNVPYTDYSSVVSHTFTKNQDVTISAKDSLGNVSSKVVTIAGLDNTQPVATCELIGGPLINNWLVKNIARIKGEDAESGVKSVTFNGITQQTSSYYDFDVSQNGTYQYYATDNAGNNSDVQTIEITNIDNIQPNLSVKLQEMINGEQNGTETNNLTTKNSAILTVDASDGQSGLDKVYVKYVPDGVDQNTVEYVGEYSAPMTITDDFNGQIFVKAVDKVGNNFEENVSLFLDKTGPTVTVTPSTTEWTNQNVTLTGNIIDVGSGLKEATLNGVQIDGENFELDIEENDSVIVDAVDNLCNNSHFELNVGNIDKISPTIQSVNFENNILTENAENANPMQIAYVNTAQNIVVQASDDLSGVQTIQYVVLDAANADSPINDADWLPYDENNKPMVNNNGTWVIATRCMDKAGNVSEIMKSNAVIFDNITPNVQPSVDDTNWTNADKQIIHVNFNDSLSGINYIKLPDGSQHDVVDSSDASLDFDVINNGPYVFMAVDKAGNQKQQSINITNFDRDAPNANIIFSILEDNLDRLIALPPVNITPSGITKNDEEVGKNDEHSNPIYGINPSSNIIELQNIKNSYIDKNLIYNIEPSNRIITNRKIKIDIQAQDNASGILSIQYQLVKDGETVDDDHWFDYLQDQTFINQSFNGTVAVKIIDNAGNENICYSNKIAVDDTAPIIITNMIPDEWTNASVVVNVEVTCGLAGLNKIILPDGTVVTDSDTAQFVADANGEYPVTAVDNAGNSTTITVMVNNIDTTIPDPVGGDGTNVDESGNRIPVDVELDWTNIPPVLIDIQSMQQAPSGTCYLQLAAVKHGESFDANTASWTDVKDSNRIAWDQEGEWDVYIRAKTPAGNVSDASHYLCRYDATVPTETHVVNDRHISLDAFDDLSGIKSITCDHGTINGDHVECTLDNMETSHVYTVVDNAGNTVNFVIDAPVTPVVPVTPVTPVIPVTPENPSGGTAVDEPVLTPETPVVVPETPVVPDKPIIPDVPVIPVVPVIPNEPAEPDKPSTSTDNLESNSVSNSNNDNEESEMSADLVKIGEMPPDNQEKPEVNAMNEKPEEKQQDIKKEPFITKFKIIPSLITSMVSSIYLFLVSTLEFIKSHKLEIPLFFALIMIFMLLFILLRRKKKNKDDEKEKDSKETNDSLK